MVLVSGGRYNIRFRLAVSLNSRLIHECRSDGDYSFASNRIKFEDAVLYSKLNNLGPMDRIGISLSADIDDIELEKLYWKSNIPICGGVHIASIHSRRDADVIFGQCVEYMDTGMSTRKAVHISRYMLKLITTKFDMETFCRKHGLLGYPVCTVGK